MARGVGAVFGRGGKSTPWWRAVAVACLFLGCCLLGGPAAGQDSAAEGVYAEFRDRVLQVLIVDVSSGSKAGLGSGFVVRDGGFLVTNYHVVSQLVYRPGRYRAEYRTHDGRDGELEVLAIDVVHDLALLQGAGLAAPALELERAAPAQGERLFSLGNPLDLGLTIVEGTYNGTLETSLLGKIHFTGSINPGMSGGPTVNARGRVVGVNVATAGNQVSFLVPSEKVAELLAAAASRPERWLDEVRDQLLTLQDQFIGRILEEPFTITDLGPFQVPGKFGSYLKCWGDTAEQGDAVYKLVYQVCSSADWVFLNGDHSTGKLSFRNEWFRADGAGPLRFYSFLEDHFETPHLQTEATKEDVTEYVCETGLVGAEGFRAETAFCARHYRRLPGLYDTVMTATSLVSSGEALHTTLALSGVSYTNALRVSQAYLEAIRWQPERSTR